jgi:urea transporter
MIKDYAKIPKHCGEVLFLPYGWVGVLLAAMTCARPTMGLAGIVAVAGAWGLAKAIGCEKAFAAHGFYVFNPLLVGCSVGYVFALSLSMAILAAMSGVLAFIVCLLSARMMQAAGGLPVLSAPFVVVSSIVHLAAGRYSSLAKHEAFDAFAPVLDKALPSSVAGFAQSLGAVFFMPEVVIGLILAAALLFYSRILFGLAIWGYAVGCLTRAVWVGTATAFSDPNAFNSLLISIALGGVFLVPSWRSYAIAGVGAALGAVVLDGAMTWGRPYSLPPYALPFNAVVLGVLFGLGWVGVRGVNLSPAATPEQTIALDVLSRKRFGGNLRGIHLPFAGPWTVWQAFDGPWTHKGPWRFAYDFVITDADGKTHTNSGDDLDDYFCFRKPVLSPVGGTVVEVVNHLFDCPIGVTDTENNWGNAVVIADPRGFFVALSHFAEGSIQVRRGDAVKRGMVLGLCGNSGYSPQPHIHVQVQLANTLGAETVPFSFLAFKKEAVFNASGLPGVAEVVEPTWPNSRLAAATSYHLDQKLRYKYTRAGKRDRETTLTVKMALDGSFYFQSDRGGRLYFGKQGDVFHHYAVDGDDEILTKIMLALPRLPLSAAPALRWEDFVPTTRAVKTRSSKALVELVAAFFPDCAATRVQQKALSSSSFVTRISGNLFRRARTITTSIAPDLGIVRIDADDWQLTRLSGEPNRQRATGESDVPVNEKLNAVFQVEVAGGGVPTNIAANVLDPQVDVGR